MPLRNILPHNKRILLVDDQESIHQDFKKILKPQEVVPSDIVAMENQLFGSSDKASAVVEEYDITSAFQGEQAVELVQQSVLNKVPFAMAFIDVRMPPGMDGIETIFRIWKIDPNIQVVICTAFSDYSWDETVAKLGKSDQLLVLKKPFDIIEVMQLAASLTAKWNLARQAEMSQQQLEDLVGVRTDALKQKTLALEKSLQELNDAKVQLFQADKLASIGQLAAGLAHEINNPIGYIACNLNTLRTYIKELAPLLDYHLNSEVETLPEEVAGHLTKKELGHIVDDLDELMDDSLEGVDRVSRIVRDLTEFSHVNAVDKVPVNLNDLMEKTISVAWNQLKHKVTIKRQLDEIPKIEANGGQLGQVMLNLLLNASQAIEKSGEIVVRTSYDNAHVHLEVEDNGGGIDPNNLAKLFDPFFTTKPVGEGTGLGLHIVHNIVSHHQGQIECSSQLGEGTCFRVSLPMN